MTAVESEFILSVTIQKKTETRTALTCGPHKYLAFWTDGQRSPFSHMLVYFIHNLHLQRLVNLKVPVLRSREMHRKATTVAAVHAQQERLVYGLFHTRDIYSIYACVALWYEIAAINNTRLTAHTAAFGTSLL